MKKYEAYKDSGIKWIERIPSHWSEEKLKYFTSCNDEVLPENTPKDQIIKYVEISDVDNVNGIKGVTEYPFQEAPSRARRITHKDDVIISTVRTYLKAITRITQEGLIVSTGFAVIRPKRVNPSFLSYLLLNEGFLGEVISKSVGVSYPAINTSDLLNIKLPLPSDDEQKAIADYLDYKVGQIDTSVADINAQIEDLKAYRQSVISEAVTKGLNPDAPVKDSGIAWIGMIPEGWSTSKVKYEVNMVLGKMLQSVEPTPNNGEYTLEYYLKSRNIGMLEVYNQEDQLDKMWFNSQEKDLYELKAGDLVMNEGGDIGKVSMWRPTDFKCYIQNSVHKLTPGENLVPEYLQYLMAFTAFKGYFSAIVSAISIAHLTKEKLADTPLILPPLPEQQAIADYLDEKTSKIDTAIKSLENQRDDLNALRQTVISEAVTGKIDLRDWKK